MKKSSKKLTWYGHNCFLFEYNDVKFLIDPFLVAGIAPVQTSDIKADYVLVSHGHSDHCANALEIARASQATIVGIAEVASFFGRQGVKTESANIGGAVYLPISKDSESPKAQILTVQATHSSTMPDNSPGGSSVGFILSFSQNGAFLSPDRAAIKPMKNVLADASAFSIYFACDTGFFADMSWIGTLGIDVAVLPVGDRYTMGPSLSLDAIKAINPQYVVPCHYNTWAPLSQNIAKWSDAVRQYTKAIPLVLTPGVAVNESELREWK
jgi:L-ascorbate metabolism protein UlaG (beta-lactamase superfamily)